MAQREITCQGVSARMMELVYGELPADERATIEAHSAACPSCRAELAAFQSTRASARRVFEADEPPARAHQAILRAAAAAVAAKHPKLSEPRAAAPQPSFWERWRARWTLPTFATIGAVAVVVLASKVFLEPDRTVDLGRQALRSTPAEAPAAPPMVPAPQAPMGAEAQVERSHPAPADKERKGEAPAELQPPVGNSAPARSVAAPTTERRRRAEPDGFGALGAVKKGGGAVSSGRGNAQASDRFPFDDDSAVAPPGGARPDKREFAPPPPPLAAPARPSAPVVNQRRERESEGEALDEATAAPRGNMGPLAGGVAAAPPPARAKAKKAEMPMEMPSPSAAENLESRHAAVAPAPEPPRARSGAPAASMGEKADARSETRAEAKPVAESPVARADRLFAQGQWAAAVRAYRELLRRDPSNGDAARWRQRLAASEEAASAQAPAAAPAATPSHR
jgi:hypothetical protein